MYISILSKLYISLCVLSGTESSRSTVRRKQCLAQGHFAVVLVCGQECFKLDLDGQEAEFMFLPATLLDWITPTDSDHSKIIYVSLSRASGWTQCWLLLCEKQSKMEELVQRLQMDADKHTGAAERWQHHGNWRLKRENQEPSTDYNCCAKPCMMRSCTSHIFAKISMTTTVPFRNC